MAMMVDEPLTRLSHLTSQSYSSLDQATAEMLRGLSDLIGVRSTFFAHVTAELFEVVASFDQGGCAIPADLQAPASDSFCQYVARSGEPLIINDTKLDPRVNSLATRTLFNIGSYVGVPVKLSNGRLFGTLCALDPDPHRFSASDVKSLTVVAHLLALYVERHLAEAVAHEQLASLQYLNEQLQAANRALEAMNQYKSDFLAAMPHEIRTPLTSMIGYTTLLQSGITGQLSEAQRASVDCIGRNAQRLVSLINDVLETSELQSGHLKLDLVDLELRPLVLEAVEAVEQAATAKGLAIKLQLAPDLPRSITNDACRMRQMLINLLSHAIDVTASGEIKLAVARASADHLTVKVHDHGPRLLAADKQSMWQAFQQIEGVTPHTALGRGLPMVHRLAALMGGAIQHRATKHGNSFVLRLPLTLSPSRAAGV